MDLGMENPALATDWKQKAAAYRSKISNGVLADYFIDTLSYLFVRNKTGQHPQVPCEV